MKTLLEQVINEIRLAKVSTGRKLEKAKTFGEMIEGDTLYYYYKELSSKVHALTIKGKEKSHLDDGYCKTSSSPDDYVFKIKNIKFDLGKVEIYVNSENTWEIISDDWDEEVGFISTSPYEITDILAHSDGLKEPANLKEILK